LDDPRGNPNVFRIRAVVEQQIFAKVFQLPFAEEALTAGSGIRCYHALTHAEIPDFLAHGDDIAGQLVPEYSGGYDHAGMVSAAKDLYVRAAGQRHLNPYENVTDVNLGNSYRLYLQMLLAVKHSSHHVVIHYDHLCG
jgi:hypothetical protein